MMRKTVAARRLRERKEREALQLRDALRVILDANVSSIMTAMIQLKKEDDSLQEFLSD